MDIEQIAKVCHEANKAYCETLGDFTQESWNKCPDWQKDSARAGVKFKLDNPESSPRDSHESWLLHKQNDGWKYGPEKNVELKEHPCFVAYDDLPLEQQIKDRLFSNIVRSFLHG